MPSVFISYRTNDYYAAHSLSDKLRRQFGDNCIFMDVDNIAGGDDFVEVIENAVGRCDALIALIGADWCSPENRQRLARADDFVRLEIATALGRKIRVIPVLLEGAEMPGADDLPQILAPLVRRQALEFRKRAPRDIDRLIDVLQAKVFQRGQAPSKFVDPPPAETAHHGAATEVPTDDLDEQLDDDLDSMPVESTDEVEAEAAAEHEAGEPSPPKLSTKIIGIDLGTTNSVVAVVEGGEAKVIGSADGNRLTPSVVAFTEKGETLVGEPARRQAVTNPAKTIYSIKRFMGRRHPEVETEEKMVPYTISGGADEFVTVDVAGRRYTPAEISARTLGKLKQAAEAYLGERITKAVITVPAYFNDSQRQATKDAGQIAGLEVCRIVNEPTAAAMAYGLNEKQDQRIVVFDLGGGTFDVSVLELTVASDEGRSDHIYEVLSTSGDTHLGGDDFDLELINHLAEVFKKDQGVDLRKDNMALQRLQEACEQAKRKLSEAEETDVNLPFITSDASGPKHLQINITRSKFEELIESFIERCQRPLKLALADAKLRPQEVDQILLVGGSTRIPRVRALIRDFFGKEPYSEINPDEVVAIGAAIQGSVLSGDRKDVLLMDVTPFTLGIETLGGVMTPLVQRNTTIPVEKRRTFSTANDNQSKVKIHVVQGERPMANDNHTLGRFYLKDIPPAKRGVPKIEVRFDIDANGILNVSAKDLATGNEQSIQVEMSAGLSAESIQRMRRAMDGELEADRRRWNLVTQQNQLDSESYTAEKLLQQYGTQVPADHIQSVRAAIQKAREAAKGEDVKAMKAALNALGQAVRAMLQAIYGGG